MGFAKIFFETSSPYNHARFAAILDVQRKLAEAGVQIPVIFITGHGDIPQVGLDLAMGLSAELRAAHLLKREHPTGTERKSLNYECGWKGGDRGGLAERKKCNRLRKEQKKLLTGIDLLMVNRPMLIRSATKT